LKISLGITYLTSNIILVLVHAVFIFFHSPIQHYTEEIIDTDTNKKPRQMCSLISLELYILYWL
jgi:hypothetical protein